jgi:hypothetical protein
MIPIALLAACASRSDQSPTKTVQDPLAAAGMDVTMTPTDFGWNVRIKNSGSATASIVWDESAFVDGSRRSRGKLIPGKTPKADIARALASEPVPAAAHVDEDVMIAEMSEWLESGAGSAGSGRASIVFQVGSSKAEWTHDVTYAIPTAHWFCSVPIGERAPANQLVGQCFGARPSCEQSVESSIGLRCQPLAIASWCFLSHYNGPHPREVAECWASETLCRRMHDLMSSSTETTVDKECSEMRDSGSLAAFGSGGR